ncbi:hypothetical protein FK535_23505 [Mycolicibacterium sp. 018/SC-01/001]|uniref:DUF7162 family protein n=1 Tax=Mycolicibacterium sp. 018/SC-01/001 TaxID=2592069 RepID=UPI00117D9F3D|nr:hypothetical protein [Mycolicibacterium sp. 018/SC-01/001]TRW78974.1 hypothetical protein FK535_23505 [Mycolicibacterium sp. 018/SC-01/001]
MGEITRVDVERLRQLADRIAAIADDIEALRCPALDGAALPGSAVADVAGAPALADEFDDMVAGLRGWALAARRSAEAFEDADRDSGGRLAG